MHTVEELRAKVQEAKEREGQLAREASELPTKIKEASRQMVKDQAEQARAGGALISVAAKSEVAELQQRQETIPYELWAARLHRAELQKQLHEAELKAARGDIPAAQSLLQEALAKEEQARARRLEASAALRGAERRSDTASQNRRAALDEIAKLEGEGPGV